MKKILKDLLAENSLPIKVHREGWADSIYFEIEHINYIWAYGHYENMVNEVFNLESDGWSVYKEPKKKVKLYKWALKNNKTNYWFETERFFENQDQLENEAYYTKPHYTEFIRLDHTMIEVEE